MPGSIGTPALTAQAQSSDALEPPITYEPIAPKPVPAKLSAQFPPNAAFSFGIAVPRQVPALYICHQAGIELAGQMSMRISFPTKSGMLEAGVNEATSTLLPAFVLQANVRPSVPNAPQSFQLRLSFPVGPLATNFAICELPESST